MPEFDTQGESRERLKALDLAIVVCTRMRLILLCMFSCGIAAALLTFVVEPVYTATAVILPPQQQSSAAMALLGQLGGMAGVASQGLGIKNPADPYVGILSSRTIADELIKRFSLKAVYRTRNLVDTRRELARRTNFASAKYSLIQVSVEDSSPARAASLANAYIELLQKENRRLAVTEASQRRLFFEQQLESEKKRLAEAESALKRTQEKKGIFQVSSQLEMVMRSIAQIRAEITAREVGILRLRTSATSENPEVMRQEAEVRALRHQLRELESSKARRSEGDPFMPASGAPEAGLEYAQRLRELKYRETLFEILAKQYESARIDEAKQAPIIQIVDQAVAPDKRASPSLRTYVMVGILLGGVSGLTIAFLGRGAHDPVCRE